MKLLLLFLLSLPAWAITCSGLVIDELSDRSITASWVSDTVSNYVRIRYGPTVVTTNTQGLAEPSATGVPANDPIRHQIGGLTPATSYALGFSASDDGVTYCAELTSTQSTAAAAASTLPTAPTDWNTNTVKPQGGTTYTVNACADLHTALTTAGHTAGTATADRVELAPGLTCLLSTHAPDGVWHFNPDGRVGAWINNWVRSGNTVTHTAHGLVNGDVVYIGSKYDYSGPPPPLAFGHGYYVVNAAANSIELSLTAGGATITLTGAGADFMVKKDQACVAEVLVTTAGASSLFPPEGTRAIRGSYALATLTNDSTSALRAFDLSWGAASCVRIANINTISDNGAAATNPDPAWNRNWWSTASQGGNHDVTLDRLTGGGANEAPSRMTGYAYPFNGTRMAIVNSDLANISFYAPFSNCTFSTSATVATIIGPCKFFHGATTAFDISTTTATITGGATTGNYYWYVEPIGGAIKFLSDPSLTVTCSGCAQVTSAAPSDFPNAGSHYTQLPLASGTLVGGAFTAVTSANSTGLGIGIAEGAAVFVGVDKGPGPTKLENNTLLNCIGICVFWTGDTYDCGGNGNCANAPLLDEPSNIIIRKNRFEVDDAHTSSKATFNQKGLWGGRNMLEWKWGRKILVTGNKIISGPTAQTSIATSILFSELSVTDTARLTATTIQDVEVSYNTVSKASRAFMVTTRYARPIWGGYPVRRFWVHNNVFTSDGSYYWTPFSAGTGDFLSLFGGQDMRFDHNTIPSMTGSNGQLINAAYYRFGNLKYDNNLQMISDTSSRRGLIYSDPTPANPVNHGLKAKAALDATATPTYSFAGNGFLCAYLDASTSTELNQAQCDTVRDAYCVGGNCATGGSLTSASYWTSGASLATRLAAVKFAGFTAGDYRLRYDSPFIGGAGLSSDGLGQGANIEALQAAQGDVSNVRMLAIGTTTATVAFFAADTTGCTVDRSSDGLATWTRVANAGGSRAQSVALTGLSSNTLYTLRLNCQAMQPQIYFRTR